MIIEDVVEFLKRVPPFQFLDESVLTELAVGMSMEFFPKGTTILRQGGPPSKYLHIIKKGGIKVFRRAANGEETIIDFRGQGDLFGYLSLVGGDKARAYVLAVENTSCYTIKKDAVRQLLDSSETVREYFLKSFLNLYIDKTFKEMQGRNPFLSGDGDRLLSSTTVGEVATSNVLTAPQDTSIREAATIMCENKISSLVLVDKEHRPVGIITDRDMRGKVVARGRDFNDPIKTVMSYPILRIDSKDYCFEAILKMMKYNVHHLIVIKDGILAGIVSHHDFMLMQGTSPMLIAKDIEGQRDIEGLADVAKQINNIIDILLKQGARAGNITSVVTEINDRLVRRVLKIATRKFGSPPVQYCWLAFGSEGRREQTFKTDQDNALVYADSATTFEAEEAKKYFSNFAVFVRDSLVACGYPFCPDAHMASNPQWCRPLSSWKKFCSNWVADPDSEMGETGLKPLTFLDFRGVGGDFSLADQLRDSISGMIREQASFLSHLAGLAVRNRPPIGFLKTVVIEKTGEHSDRLDLKVKGLAPIVALVRLFAIEEGLRETSTLARLDMLRERRIDIAEFAEELAHAFEFIMLLRIQHQFGQVSRGQVPDSIINPDILTNLQKKTIKEAFILISKIQDAIAERYNSMKRQTA